MRLNSVLDVQSDRIHYQLFVYLASQLCGWRKKFIRNDVKFEFCHDAFYQINFRLNRNEIKCKLYYDINHYNINLTIQLAFNII